jgi:hypothetical protein
MLIEENVHKTYIDIIKGCKYFKLIEHSDL